jgi:hypothetical protein
MLGDVPGAPACTYDLHCVAHPGITHAPLGLDQFRMPRNHTQPLIEIMGHSPRPTTDGFRFLRLQAQHPLFFRPLAIRNVAHKRHETNRLALSILHARSSQPYSRSSPFFSDQEIFLVPYLTARIGRFHGGKRFRMIAAINPIRNPMPQNLVAGILTVEWSQGWRNADAIAAQIYDGHGIRQRAVKFRQGAPLQTCSAR